MAKLSLHEFADKLSEIMPLMAKEFVKRQASEIYKGKITLPQFLIMNILQKGEENTMTALARYMEVSTAAMTGLVGRLVRDGYALRGFDPDDRRIIKIKLTSKGSLLVEKTLKQRREMIIDLFGRIPQEQREVYLKVLMKIKDILSKDKNYEKSAY